MKFVSPSWLWLLLGLPLLFYFGYLKERSRLESFKKFASSKMWKWISPEMNRNVRAWRSLFFLLCLCFCIIAIARPQWGSHTESVHATGLDVLFVLDISQSMEVKDVVPSRLQKAKHVIRSVVENMQGDRAGLIAFAGSAYVVCPLTTDLSYFLDTVQTTDPSTIQSQGTDIHLGLETALMALERGAEESAQPSHVVIVISDGEEHQGSALQTAAKLKNAKVQFYVLGVGTEMGGPVPLSGEYKAQGFKKDLKGETVISRFNPQFLQKLAQEGGGKYQTVTLDESEVRDIINEMGRLTRTDYAERTIQVFEERFQYPLFFAILFLLIEISISYRKRKLTLLASLGIPFFLITSGFAYGEENLPLDAYLENKKGLDAYSEGRFEDAAKNFGAAQVRDPLRPELLFNQGVVQFNRGELESAAQAFQKAIEESQKKGNDELQAKSFFNLGQTFAKMKKNDEAVQSYLNAIRAAEKLNDEKLAASARKNLQLLEQEMQRQKQQKNQGEEEKQNPKDKDKDKNKDKGEGKEQEKDSSGGDSDKNLNNETMNAKESKESKENGSESDQDSEQQSRRYDSKSRQKNPFQSNKMNAQDAERVMEELAHRERRLREKLQKGNGRSEPQSKDW